MLIAHLIVGDGCISLKTEGGYRGTSARGWKGRQEKLEYASALLLFHVDQLRNVPSVLHALSAFARFCLGKASSLGYAEHQYYRVSECGVLSICIFSLCLVSLVC